MEEKIIKPLKIGNLVVRKPIIQGGMGVGISLSSLAGSVARAGGLGVISAAQIGFKDPDFKKHAHLSNIKAIFSEIKKAREISEGGALGINIMVATKEYGEQVKAAVKAGVDVIISGAGLPTALPEYVKQAEDEMYGEGCCGPAGTCAEEGTKPQETPGNKAHSYGTLRTKLAPIVSSLKSVSVICRYWDKKYRIAPDMVVIEGPLAGGHLGFAREKLNELGADTENVGKTYKKAVYQQEIRDIINYVKELGLKYGKKIPVAVAGGVYTHEDVKDQFGLGADAVQVATRFVTTKECDAPMEYKQSYIDAREEDIMIVKSPVGMPGRAIKNAFIDKVSACRQAPRHCFSCMNPCDPSTAPYCITDALINAARGNIDNGLLFCGSNAWRARKIETVDEVMDDLLGACV